MMVFSQSRPRKLPRRNGSALRGVTVDLAEESKKIMNNKKKILLLCLSLLISISVSCRSVITTKRDIYKILGDGCPEMMRLSYIADELCILSSAGADSNRSSPKYIPMDAIDYAFTEFVKINKNECSLYDQIKRVVQKGISDLGGVYVATMCGELFSFTISYNISGDELLVRKYDVGDVIRTHATYSIRMDK